MGRRSRKKKEMAEKRKNTITIRPEHQNDIPEEESKPDKGFSFIYGKGSSRGGEDFEAEAQKGEKRILLATMTSEPYQLARIYYDLFNKKKVEGIFSRLRCMDHDKVRDRWVWLYHGEAKKLKFKTSYSQIQKRFHPIVLGSFFLKTDEEMFINVNSFDRATKAILFFNKRIPAEVARVTDIEVVNKVFQTRVGSPPEHEDYLDKCCVERSDGEELLANLMEIKSSIKDPDESLKAVYSHVEDISKKPMPEIERFPTHFNEQGIGGLKASLTMRQTIAFEHWAGNKNYTFYDLTSKVIMKKRA